MIDTDTRLIRPDELTAEVLAELDPAAAALCADEPTLEVEDARPVDELYRGRHRTTDDLATRRLNPVQVTAALEPDVPRMYRRKPGAALAGLIEAHSMVGPVRLLARCLRASRKVLGPVTK